MRSRVRIIPWLEGRCSFYAIERDGVCLPDAFMADLQTTNIGHAQRLWAFLETISQELYIRQAYLRPERPELGVFAMYNHKELESERYNPSRLLCSYASGGNRILVVGSGFLKSNDQPIQRNGIANSEAEYLAAITKQLNERIGHGEITIDGSRLVPRFHDSLEF